MFNLEASIHSRSDSDLCGLGVTPDVIIGDVTWDDIAQFSDNLASMVRDWRAHNEIEELTGSEKLLAEIILGELRTQIAEINEEAARNFPEDAVFGGYWTFKVEDGAESTTAGFAVPVEALVKQLARAFAAAQRAIDASPEVRNTNG